MALEITDESTIEINEELADMLGAFNHANSDVGNAHQKAFVVRDEQGQLMGGVVLVIHWHWLFIEILVVREASRNLGVGSQLLRKAETYAKSLGCVGAYLDTVSFQAPDFYIKHGYEVLARLAGFPPGPHQKIYLFKRF